MMSAGAGLRSAPESGQAAEVANVWQPRLLSYLTQLARTSAAPSSVRYPELSARPRHDPAHFPIVAALEENFRAIRGEVESLPAASFHRESERIPRRGAWDVAFLYERGRRHDDVCGSCPTLTSIVERFRTVRTPAGMIYVSRLGPATTLAPHKGPTNFRLRCHLGIRVPASGCGIQVGCEARIWQEGRCMVFDDSFPHLAWNKAPEDRIIVVIDLWHPDLAEEEILALSGLHRYVTFEARALQAYLANNARARAARGAPDETASSGEGTTAQ
jgi:aspartyl/asparaginyl beta-hydroxylase (cupin superfamily)